MGPNGGQLNPDISRRRKNFVVASASSGLLELEARKEAELREYAKQNSSGSGSKNQSVATSNDTTVQIDTEDKAILGTWQYLYYYLDEKLRLIEEKLIMDHAVNREWAFFRDNMAPIVAHMIVESMFGEGVEITYDGNQKITDYLTKWNKNVSKTHSVYSLKRMLTDIMVDNINHAEALFIKRKVQVDERQKVVFEGVDGYTPKGKVTDCLAVFPLDMKYIKTVSNQTTGAKKWVQTTWTTPDMEDPNDMKMFYSDAYNPGGASVVGDYYGQNLKGKLKTTMIPDYMAVSFNLFASPPMSSAMNFISFKMWILWAMRVAAERRGLPMLWAEFVDENHELADDDVEAILKDMVEMLQQNRFADVHAMPPGWSLNTMDAHGNFDFIGTLSWLNSQIVLALGSSMSLYEASGTELATSRTIEKSFNRAIKGRRSEIEEILRDLYWDVLDVGGFSGFDVEKLKFTWPPVEGDAFTDLVQTVNTLTQMEVKNLPVLKDVNEARGILGPYFNLKQFTDKEMQEMQEEQQPQQAQPSDAQFAQQQGVDLTSGQGTVATVPQNDQSSEADQNGAPNNTPPQKPAAPVASNASSTTKSGTATTKKTQKPASKTGGKQATK